MSAKHTKNGFISSRDEFPWVEHILMSRGLRFFSGGKKDYDWLLRTSACGPGGGVERTVGSGQSVAQKLACAVACSDTHWYTRTRRNVCRWS